MIGKTVGNYRVISRIGEGGMGTVYLAEHPEIGRKAAVKVLRRELAQNASLFSRFLAEARAANAIGHPNIIQVIDFGRLDDGGPYILMEFLEGESLAARIKRMHRIRVGDAVEFAYQAASALGAAHAKGVVHRDLKPDNLFLIPDAHVPGRDQLKVLDFGIAKLQGSMNTGSLRTMTGALMGTPIYMSPEQCRGTKELDRRTDIYSLGIIVYEMLSGSPPFMSEGLGDLLEMHMNAVPPSLQARVPGVPEHLEAMVMRALSKRPEDRFPNAAEFQRALGGGPARTPGAPEEPSSNVANLETIAAPALAEGQFTGRAVQVTTLSGSAGETKVPRGVSRRVLPVAGGGLVAVIAGAFLLFGSADRTPAPTTPRAAPAVPVAAPLPPPPPSEEAVARSSTVRLTVDSTPPGAALVDPKDGSVLGKTPLSREFPKSTESLKLRLERDGYVPATISLPLTRDDRVEVTLKKISRARRSPRMPSVLEDL